MGRRGSPQRRRDGRRPDQDGHPRRSLARSLAALGSLHGGDRGVGEVAGEERGTGPGATDGAGVDETVDAPTGDPGSGDRTADRHQGRPQRQQPADLRHRPTNELVILVFTAVVGVILLVGTFGVLAVELIHPSRDTDLILGMIFDVSKVLIGAIIGYAAGRSASSN